MCAVDPSDLDAVPPAGRDEVSSRSATGMLRGQSPITRRKGLGNTEPLDNVDLAVPRLAFHPSCFTILCVPKTSSR
jgi:hypothetical protein